MLKQRMAKLVTAACACAVLVAAAAPASATTLRKDGSTGDPYAGNIRATDITDVVFQSSIRAVTCNQSTLDATVTSNGSDADVTAASWSNNGGACINSDSGTTAITAQSLPWSNGTFAYSPVAGGRDGTLTMSNVKAKTVGSSGMTCFWRGSGTNNSITLDLYNKDNPNRPVSSVSEAQADAVNESFTRDTGSDFLCPSSATLTGTYKQLGETSAGVFNQSLYLTR